MKRITTGLLGMYSLIILAGCMSTQLSQIDGNNISATLDINQDGTADSVEVYYLTPEQIYSDDNEKMNDAYPSYIKVIISGNETVIPVEESYIYDAAIQTLISEDHSPIIIVTFDVGGALGNQVVYAVTFQGNGIRELPFPEIEPGVFGCNFDITYFDMYEVAVLCSETGYSTKMRRPQSTFDIKTEGIDNIYDEYGRVTYQPQTFIHRPNSVEIAKQDGEMCLLLKQSISEIVDANVWGEIRTFLTWDSDGKYEIIDQQVTPCP